jgi:hypothetical protein
MSRILIRFAQEFVTPSSAQMLLRRSNGKRKIGKTVSGGLSWCTPSLDRPESVQSGLPFPRETLITPRVEVGRIER